MSKYILTITLFMIILVSGCAYKENNLRIQQEQIVEKQYEDNEKEYRYLLQALYLKEHKNYSKAYELFMNLYKQNPKKEYLFEATKVLIALKQYEKSILYLNKLISIDKNDLDIYRLLSVSYSKLGNRQKALKIANRALAIDPKNIEIADLLASIYLTSGDIKGSLKVYKNIYNRYKNEDSLIRIVSILYYKMDNKKVAREILQKHCSERDCNEKSYLFLTQILSNLKEFDELAKTYEMLYKKSAKSEYAKKAVEIYVYQKEYEKAIELLESYNGDDKLLLSLYKLSKKFNKALSLAQKLYKKTNDPIWEAEYGVLLYESSNNKNDKKLIKKVEKVLKSAIEKGVDDALYLNYLGYLLIDHDINIVEGIEFVKKALKQVPNSPYYLDSLAWGYYKLKRCNEAYELMKKVVKAMGLEDEVVKEHWEKIQKCRSKIR